MWSKINIQNHPYQPATQYKEFLSNIFHQKEKNSPKSKKLTTNTHLILQSVFQLRAKQRAFICILSKNNKINSSSPCEAFVLLYFERYSGSSLLISLYHSPFVFPSFPHHFFFSSFFFFYSPPLPPLLLFLCQIVFI